MKLYGIVLLKFMKENHLNKPFYNHEEMFNEIKTYLKNCKETNYWDEEAILSNIKYILNHYMGEPPTKFRYNGRTYTPQRFHEICYKTKP